MKTKQITLRIEALILKDNQMIRGYQLAILNSKNQKRIYAYKSIIEKLKNSKERKKEALKYLKDNPDRYYNWRQFCFQFGFRPYKIER